MLQAQANPWGIIKYVCKILDSNIDPEDFAPVMPPMPQGQPGQQPQPGPQQGGQQPKQPGLVGQQQGGQGLMGGVQKGGPH